MEVNVKNKIQNFKGFDLYVLVRLAIDEFKVKKKKKKSGIFKSGLI